MPQMSQVKSCKRCVVTGKVQGVFYRQATLREAESLKLTGWVRNLANGDVECVLCGDPEAVEAMCEWLWEGPPTARVDDVKVKDIPPEDYSIFSIRR